MYRKFVKGYSVRIDFYIPTDFIEVINCIGVCSYFREVKHHSEENAAMSASGFCFLFVGIILYLKKYDLRFRGVNEQLDAKIVTKARDLISFFVSKKLGLGYDRVDYRLYTGKFPGRGTGQGRELMEKEWVIIVHLMYGIRKQS